VGAEVLFDVTASVSISYGFLLQNNLTNKVPVQHFLTNLLISTDTFSHIVRESVGFFSDGKFKIVNNHESYRIFFNIRR